jgi:hypothetical protein
MANLDNNCADLELKEKYEDYTEHLTELMKLQKDIQENVYGYNFSELENAPLRKVREFWDWNYHALQDEFREAYDALGGIHDGIKNASWKPWKKDYKKMDELTLAGMSERDRLELMYELVDAQHFLFNMMISVGMDGKKLFELYWAKNMENRARQERGY